MRGIAFGFFSLGVLWVTMGMILGLYMGAHNDFTLAPAHAHLNLVGWVTFALFGLYYHVTPAAAASGMARIHLGVAVIGLVIMVPGIAIAATGGAELPVFIGSLISFASMLIFGFTVLKNGLGNPA
jgi:hypothetical protein